MDVGTLILCGLKPGRVLEAMDVAMAHYAETARPFDIAPDYAARNVSKKVVRIILSYTDYVNRTVWFKPPDCADPARSER